MTTTPPQTRPRPRTMTSAGTLIAAAVALLVAFRLLPAAIADAAVKPYAGITAIRAALERGLIEPWDRGQATFPPGMADLVGYWRAWHATKIVICVAMLVVLVLLARELWRASSGRGRGTRWAAAFVTALVPLVAVVLAVNVQSTVAPSIALLPVLESPAGDASRVVDAMAGELTSSAGALTAPVQALVDDMRAYDVALAVTALLLAIAFAWVGLRAWSRRRTATSDRTRRSMLTTLAVTSALGWALMAFLAVTSAISAADPAGALLGKLGAG
jgi:hypothetical protein